MKRDKRNWEQEYYQRNKEHIKNRMKKNRKSSKLDYYLVYYLPEENYVGMTQYPTKRISNHRRKGKNVDGWRVLYCSNDKMEAGYHEALFQSVLGMKGLNIK